MIWGRSTIDSALLYGAQIIGGKITRKKVAEAFVLEYHPAESHID
jgi:hypothetical protein